MTATATQLAEGIAAGLVRVSFTAPTEPRPYAVTITNGSGRKSTTVTATRQSTAAEWAARWAASLGAGWYLADVTDAR